MKRFAVFLLAAALVFSLACCSMPPVPAPPALSDETPPVEETEAPPAEEITLELLLCREGSASDEWYAAFAAQFEAGNPGLRLRLELVSADEARRRVAEGQVPDLLVIDEVADFAAEGLLLPAAECCPEALYADFFPVFLEGASEGGVVWALPDLVSLRTLYYDPVLLAQAGLAVPTSWDEVEEACQAVLDYYDGAVCPWGLSLTAEESAACFACYAWSAGGGFVDAQGAWALDREGNAEAVDFAVGLADKGFTNANPAADSQQTLREMFAAGSLAMLITEGSPSESAAAALVPAAAGQSGCAVGSADCLAVFRDDSAPDQAARREAVGKLLAFYYDSARYAERAALEGLLPASASGAAALDPAGGDWSAILGSCRRLPSDRSGWDAVCAGLYSVEQLALIGGDAQAALDALQDTLSSGG